MCISCGSERDEVKALETIHIKPLTFSQSGDERGRQKATRWKAATLPIWTEHVPVYYVHTRILR